MRLRVRLLAPLTATAVVGGLVAPAAGFFFPGWPGARVPVRQTIIPPEVPPEGNPPSANPPPEEQLPPGGGEQPGPSRTPEPGTLTAALLGLAAVGARVAAKRRGRK